MDTILFFSYKGGVGRSSILCNTAAALCRQQKRVGIIDFDIEAPSIYLQLKKFTGNIKVDEFTSDILTLLKRDAEDLDPKLIKDATLKINFGIKYNDCKVIPCFGRVNDLDDLETQWNDKYYALDLIFKIFTDNEKLDFLLIDARTGLSRQAMLGALSANQLVAITKADNISAGGMKNMIEICHSKPMEKIHLLISAIPSNIASKSKKIDTFISELNCESEPICIPYYSKWYFGSNIMLKKTDENKKMFNAFDSLAKEIIG